MNPLVVVILLAALLALATAVGVAVRASSGRTRATAGSETVRVSELVAAETGGSRATLLQFSTEVCSPCVAAGVQLGKLARDLPGVRHIDVDVTHRPDLARRFDLLQSPTVLLLDGTGAIRARIGGAPRIPELRREIDLIEA
jgi:thiol-disulfide isomerase/thioredoxin